VYIVRYSEEQKSENTMSSIRSHLFSKVLDTAGVSQRLKSGLSEGTKRRGFTHLIGDRRENQFPKRYIF
jgi:hypothetical protein